VTLGPDAFESCTKALPAGLIMESVYQNGVTRTSEGFIPSPLQSGTITDGLVNKISTKTSTGVSITNGVSGPAALAASVVPPINEDDSKQTNGLDTRSQLPDLESHADSLVPFGKIIGRLAQQAYFELSETMESMADMTVTNQPQLANGTTTSINYDKSQISVAKKLKLLQFAQTQKDRFIKVLVLSDWARNMNDMIKLIDVGMYLRKHDWAVTDTTAAVYRLREDMMGAKMPAPNIEGALELLSTGKASWMPDLSYLPEKPMAADEILEVIDDMNFALLTRLTTNEDLPSQLQTYSIANGRVTFVIDDELELDLAVIDDDPENPFYFIDLRFLRISVTDMVDNVRNLLEMRTNEAMSKLGLKGGYDFIHDFFLTYKLGLIYSQTHTLIQGRYIDNLEVESIHRSLVLRYWTGLQGPKNWLELGIISDSPANQSPRTTNSTSAIWHRWFRRGQEVIDSHLQFDFCQPSAENILEQCINTHAQGRLNILSQHMQELSTVGGSFSTHFCTTSDQHPAGLLQLDFEPLDTSIQVSINPIKGTFCIQPHSLMAQKTENRMNSALTTDTAIVLREHLCRQTKSLIDDLAVSIGLVVIPTARPDNRSDLFRNPMVAISHFRRPNWDSEFASSAGYALTAAVDLHDGLTWYLTWLNLNAERLTIENCERLETDKGKNTPLNIELLSKIERLAVLKACQNQSIPYLRDIGINYRIPPSRQLTDRLFFKIGHLVNSSSPMIFCDVGSLQFHDVSCVNNSISKIGIVHSFRTEVARALADTRSVNVMRQLYHKLKSNTAIKLNHDGKLCISFATSINDAIIPMISHHLHRIDQLYRMLEVLTDEHYAAQDFDLTKISFSYSNLLRCIIKFPIATNTMVPTIEFLTNLDESTVNPHTYIQHQLQSLLSPDSAWNGIESFKFASFCQILRATLPILKAYQEFQETIPAMSASLRCRSPTSFRLAYKSPLPEIAFSIVAKSRRGKLFWIVKVVEVHGGGIDETVKVGMSRLLRSKGDGWTGLRNAAMSNVDGIEELMTKIDKIMRWRYEEKDADIKQDQLAKDIKVNDGQEVVVLD